ncbi:MAG: hypothetical protein MUF68_03450 [Cyclobacteriaceae bacterium]|jgi:L-asparagine transporter-like permease|nr:hypothetical protein [Cyclobacteriaceae bacterium]
MKPLHALYLVAGAGLFVVGMNWQKSEPLYGSLMKYAGAIVLVLFAYVFFKHLKSNNETTSE